MIKSKQKICYLCGKKILRDISYDHVPPKQFYGKSIRCQHTPNLLTIPTHKSCNKAYQLDEDYFVHSLAPLAIESYCGKSVAFDIRDNYQSGKNKKLSQMILKEFEKNPSGIILQKGRILKRFDGNRIYRVAWKIIRGLFYYKEGACLPDDTPRKVLEFIGPADNQPEYLPLLSDISGKGSYPGVFDYRYKMFPDIYNAYLWAMLYWDKLIIIFMFHNPITTKNGYINNEITT